MNESDNRSQLLGGTMLAAGLDAQGAGFLMQADLLPPLGSDLWDTSFLLSETSVPGKVLHTLVGYVARPTGVQLLFNVLTIVMIGTMMRLLGKGALSRRHSVSAVMAAGVAAGGMLGWPAAAHADFLVRSPIVDYREFEYEHNGSVTFDRKPELNKSQSYTHALALGVTPFWKIELEGATAAPSGSNLGYAATTIENFFQLTPQGKYWADAGFFFEYSQGAPRGSTNTIKFGPMVQKETSGFGRYGLLHTLNLFFEREVGPFSTTRTGFLPAWQSRVQLNPLFEPGFEVYGSIDNFTRAGKFNEQQYNAGPMFAGNYVFAPYGKIKYELGYLFGITPATPHGAVRWKFEYEIPF